MLFVPWFLSTNDTQCVFSTWYSISFYHPPISYKWHALRADPCISRCSTLTHEIASPMDCSKNMANLHWYQCLVWNTSQHLFINLYYRSLMAINQIRLSPLLNVVNVTLKLKENKLLFVSLNIHLMMIIFHWFLSLAFLLFNRMKPPDFLAGFSLCIKLPWR